MKANEALSSHIDSLFSSDPVSARRLVREIKDRCEISTAVYSNWRVGRTPIRKLERREITQILGVDIFENVTD